KHLALYGSLGGHAFSLSSSREIVGEINTRTASYADRFIYSPEQAFTCRGVDGTVTDAAEILLNSGRDVSIRSGKQLVFFTDRGIGWINVSDYQREAVNPLRPTVRFWTHDLETLHRVAECDKVEVVHFISDGVK